MHWAALPESCCWAHIIWIAPLFSLSSPVCSRLKKSKKGWIWDRKCGRSLPFVFKSRKKKKKSRRRQKSCACLFTTHFSTGKQPNREITQPSSFYLVQSILLKKSSFELMSFKSLKWWWLVILHFMRLASPTWAWSWTATSSTTQTQRGRSRTLTWRSVKCARSDPRRMTIDKEKTAISDLASGWLLGCNDIISYWLA